MNANETIFWIQSLIAGNLDFMLNGVGIILIIRVFRRLAGI